MLIASHGWFLFSVYIYNNSVPGLTPYIETRTRESWQEIICIFKQDLIMEMTNMMVYGIIPRE